MTTSRCLVADFKGKVLNVMQEMVVVMFTDSSSSSAAIHPGVGFGLLYKLIPLLSIYHQLLPIIHLEHFHMFEDSIDPSFLGSSCWPFPEWFPVG
jgi:hypothetical protein